MRGSLYPRDACSLTASGSVSGVAVQHRTARRQGAGRDSTDVPRSQQGMHRKWRRHNAYELSGQASIIGSVKKLKHRAQPIQRNRTKRADARPTSELNLTKEEIAMLPDPDWVTEDDADAIMSLRSIREGGAIPLEDVLKEMRERRVAR
jgi:hypothetical protein